MALTLTQLQAKRDEILQDIETASVSFPNGISKSFVIDKQRALATLQGEIDILTASSGGNKRLRRTVILGNKGF